MEATTSNHAGHRRVSLSLQQESFWNWANRTWKYPISTELKLRGALRTDLLHKSLRTVVQRHQALRTRIVVSNGTPMQEIADDCAVLITIVDLSDLDRDEAHTRAVNLLDTLYRGRVNLAEDPPFQVDLIRLSPLEHVLFVAVHHIIADSVSFSILLRELFTLYGECLEERCCSLPSVPMQYADYALWQRLSASRAVEAHRAYWKQRLFGAARIRFPVDDGLGDIKPFSVGQLTISFGETLSRAIHDLARRKQTTTAMIMISIYAALVSCWCNQRDFVLPFDVTGRMSSEHASVVGLLAHGLALRIQLTGAEELSELLELVSHELFSAYRASDFGRFFTDFRDVLEGSPSLQWFSWHPVELGGPIFPVAFQTPTFGLDIESFRTRSSLTEDGLPDDFQLKSDGMWRFVSTAHGIVVRVYFRADLFKESTMQRLSQALLLVSDELVKDTETSVASLKAKIDLLRECAASDRSVGQMPQGDFG